mmetsp:Transcript_8798/g.12367  ORF Transcript_8798/g.12367 Transcript_8798/m.12367 type:complete len:161 (+) Transcript_8798:57-539(+)
MKVRKLVETLDTKLKHEEEMVAVSLPSLKKEWNESLVGNSAPDLSLKYNLAFQIVKSTSKKDKELGLMLLDEMIEVSHHTKECLYLKALCLYGMGEYEKSRNSCEALLRRDPDHKMGRDLHACIRFKIEERNKAIGLNVTVGVFLAGVAGVAAIVFSRGR